MSEYGLLQEVVTQPRATALTTAAIVTDTELVVDSAGDFDDENGGTLQLNGAQLDYTAIEWGVTEDDSDTIVLTDPLEVAADVDDSVAPVIGGLPAEDWYAVVDMGLGDPVMVPLDFAQRVQWPQGLYDPPVPVMVSEDLQRLEDAPGRPASASARVDAWNADEWAAAGDDTDSPGTLTFTPRPTSLMVFQNGLRLAAGDFTLDGRVATALAAETPILSSDGFSAYYLYDPAAEVLTLPPIETLIAFSVSGWRYLQVALADTTDYSSSSFDDSGWSTGATMFGNGVGAGAGAATNWDEDTSLWLRRTFPRSQGVTITVPVEDNCDVYVNGTLVGSSGVAGLGATNVSPPFVVAVSDLLVGSGTNTLAIRANDEAGSSGADQTSVNVEVTGRLLS